MIETYKPTSRTVLEIKRVDAGGFDGYGSVFYKIDRHRDIVMPGAFKESLPKFLKEGFIGGVGHDHNDPAGKYTEAHEDEYGLYVKGVFSDVASAHKARTLIRDGVVQKLSVGFDPIHIELASPSKVEKIWKSAGYTPSQDDLSRLKSATKIRLILKADLREVSPVTIPSNDEARILSVKGWHNAPAEFRAFMQTARAAIVKLSTVNTKAGRVLSGKNEMKLRAMLDVLSSVSEELNNLLLLVSQAPSNEDVDTGAEEEDEDEAKAEAAAEEEGDEVTDKEEESADKEQVSTDEAKVQEDDKFAKQKGKDKQQKSDPVSIQVKAILLLAEAI